MPRRRDDSDDDDERSESADESEDVSDDVSEDSDEEDAESTAGMEAKHLLVEQDLVEIKKMMEGMDKIKARLQFRLGQERRRSSQAASCPSRRRSTVEEIVVPPSATAGVQTTWDMARMYEVEKIVNATDQSSESNTTMKQGDTNPPQEKPAQLSLHDLARTFGIQDAVFGAESSMRPPSPTRSPTRGSLRSDKLDSEHSPQKRASQMWEGLTLHGSDLNDSSLRQVAESPSTPGGLNSIPLNAGLDQGSVPSSQPLPGLVADSFGSPVSPVHSSDPLHPSGTPQEEKSIEQREMEAVKELLFF